jgi:hypothetical protein
MASEDSDQVLSGGSPVHRFGDFCDLDETIDIRMPANFDDPHATRELLEISLLRRPERMSLEERYYRPQQLRPPVHDELAQMLPMIVVSLADVHSPDPEEATQLLERRPTSDSLRHDKSVRHLIPSLVASAVRPARLPYKPDGEASLSVYKASDPSKLDQSFLLVFCTRHIVTVPPTWDGTRSARYSGFPAYSRMLTT